MYSISTLNSPALKAEPNLTQTPVHAALEPATHDLPLLAHRISAGFPSPAADYIEVGLDLNDYLVRNKPATFLFTVKGDSMSGASIEEGDKVKLTLPTDYPHAPPKGARARALLLRCCRCRCCAAAAARRLCISASSVTPPMGDVKSFSPGQVAK